MQRKFSLLALAAMVLVATGGTLAAPGGDGPAAPQTDAQPLPDEYTVDVTDPNDALTDDAVDAAMITAWQNDAVQRHVADDATPHFEVVARSVDAVQVSVAPGPDARPQVVADVDLSSDLVTEVFKPDRTASSSETINVDSEDITVRPPADRASDLDALVTYGTFSFSVSDEDGWLTDRSTDAEALPAMLMQDLETADALNRVFDNGTELETDVYGDLKQDTDRAFMRLTAADAPSASASPVVDVTVDLSDDNVTLTSVDEGNSVDGPESPPIPVDSVLDGDKSQSLTVQVTDIAVANGTISFDVELAP
jgi:hypothetical protein